jgi:hypothetical protein
MRGLHRLFWLQTEICRECSDDRASQIAEFAVSLPLLVLFVIGILDFSSAITLKQKLTNAAREGARVAAADPANDLGNPSTASLPVSVVDAFYVVDNYLLAEKINDCGLGSALPSSAGGLTWTSNAQANGCPASGVTFTINRGYYFSQTGAGPVPASCAPAALANGQTAVIGTCVSVQYPYKWQFAGVSGLFGGFTIPSNITTAAVAFNEN